jgi:cystathionine gamma-lyase
MEPDDDFNGSSWGPGTRAVHAGLPPAANGQPMLPGPSLAAPVHLSGEGMPEGYGRYANLSWSLLEAAVGELEGGEALVFASGMAAVTAVAMTSPGPMVVPGDGYPGIRGIVQDRLGGGRFVATSTEAVLEAGEGAALIWLETPSNPLLDVVDVAAVRAAFPETVIVVDNSLATPLGQRPLDLGATVSVAAATKSLSGHSDLLLGYVASRDQELLARVRAWRDQTGGIASPFDAWLAHRSIATAELRLQRQSANALAVAEALRSRGVRVWHPSDHPVAARQMRLFGPLVGFDLGTEDEASRFLGACHLVAEATSFGGVHSTAERRARWGTDAVGPGFIRFSAGCEDTDDLVADVLAAL